MLKKENSGILKVDIKSKDLFKMCYWTALKYKNDKYHYQKVGNKNESIGCFFDHWIQKLPEELILKKLLEREDFDIVEDYFIYGQDTQKNCPDVIGLKKESEIYPFTYYNNGNWEMNKNAPFVEVKTFKKSHKLITIKEAQLDDEKYYPIIISNLSNDYLLHLFKDEFFNENNFNEIKIYEEFIKSNEKLIYPEKLKKSNQIGTYELLGIYKGTDLKKLSIKTNENVIYLHSIEKRKIKEKISVEINDGLYYHENKYKCIPICIKKDKNSKIILKNKMKTFIEVKIEGKVIIDNEILKNGNYRLIFKTFKKSNDNSEYILSKNALLSYVKSKHEELITKFNEFINENL